jgi:hypothetical protein
MPEKPKEKTGEKPPAKPKRKRRPIDQISDEELRLRIAMRETGALDEDTDPANEESLD